MSYFWGGKSAAIGWDSRWGTPTKVTSDGSTTTGTIRPYGLDCSGYVDWVFNNALGATLSQGGGTHYQRNNSTNITWSEALPGDVVFYPEDSHIGIIAGIDNNSNFLILHCASGYNNVVVTSIEGFNSVARPNMLN